MTTSELLKQYRLRANKTQKEWAGSAISPSFYCKVEKGLNHISADDLINLLDYNGISAAEFFGDLRPKKKLQDEREQELIKLMNDAYYQNSSSELERLQRVIEHEKLPNQKNLLLQVKSYIALVNDDIKNLSPEAKIVIREKIFNLANLDKNSLANYCTFMQLYNFDDNLLIARKIIQQFQGSNDVEIQERVLGIIFNLLYLCIDSKNYVDLTFFIKVADSIPARPELVFYKSILIVMENLYNYHFENKQECLDKCLKATDFLSFIGMDKYSKKLVTFIEKNK